MKKVITLAVLFGASQLAFAGCIGPVIMGECKGIEVSLPTWTNPAPTSNTLVPDAYGPGVHMNQYGQAVVLQPQGGGTPGERLTITPNAYGPGVHMDQYGRMVREQAR